MAISTETKVGFFFLLTLVALGVLIEVVEDWNPFEKRTPYHTFFGSSIGLKTGDPVRMAGVDVGKIRAITLEEGRVRVDFQIRQETVLKADSLARIRSTNLLGGQFLGLDFGSSTSAPLPPGSRVASEEGTSIDQLVANFDRNATRVLRELSRLAEGPMTNTMARMESVVTKVDEGQGMLGRMVNDPALYEELTAAVKDLKTTLYRLNNGGGTLGRLLNDPTLYDEAQTAMANLRLISDRLRSGEGTLGRLLADDKLYEEASAGFSQLRAIAAKANEGEGTLGKLVNDPALYDEMRSAMTRINSIAVQNRQRRRHHWSPDQRGRCLSGCQNHPAQSGKDGGRHERFRSIVGSRCRPRYALLARRMKNAHLRRCPHPSSTTYLPVRLFPQDFVRLASGHF